MRSILTNLFGNFLLKDFSAGLSVSLRVAQFREKQTDHKECKTLAKQVCIRRKISREIRRYKIRMLGQ